MNRFIPIAVAVSALAAFASPLSATPVSLTDVQKALAATTTMTADFEQTAANGAVSRGTVQLKRPGRIRFDFGKGSPVLIVADGNRLSFVDYKVSQVSQWPVRSTPLGVLLDPKADLARVAKILPDSESPMPGQIAVSAQDSKRPEIGKMLFFLSPDKASPGGLRLNGWRVIDAQNNLTTVELSNIRTNVAIAESAFTFRDPRPRNRPPGKSH